MRMQTAIGIALAALATAALAQVVNTPGQGNIANIRGDIRVDELAPAANETLLGNRAPAANGSTMSNSTPVEDAATSVAANVAAPRR